MKIKKTLACISLSLAVTAASVLVGAWFANKWESGQTVSFTAATNPAPEVKVWTYLTAEEAGAENGAWTEQTPTGDGNEGYGIGSVEYTQEGDNYTFTLSSLHMGTVDNLVKLREDNIVYLRVKLDPNTHGKNISLSMTYDGAGVADYMTVYDQDGAQVGDLSALADFKFLQYQYCISATEYTPSASGFGDIFTSAAVDFGATPFTVSTDNTTSYYLYVKIIPNLDAFGEASGVLNSYMPCVALFDTVLDITVH